MKDIFDNGIGISVPSSLEEHLILDWSDVIKLPLTGAVTLQNEILRDGESRFSYLKKMNKKNQNDFSAKCSKPLMKKTFLR